MVFLVVFACRAVSKWWHARFIGRVWGGRCALPRSISFILHCWLYVRLLSPLWPKCWSLCPCTWCWAYFFPFWSLRPQVCSVLVWSVPMYLSLQADDKVAFEDIPVFGACRPACHDSSIIFIVFCPGSFPWGCIVAQAICSLHHFLSAHCSRWVGGCLQPSPLSLRCSS